jgi:hypothetical protein
MSPAVVVAPANGWFDAISVPFRWNYNAVEYGFVPGSTIVHLTKPGARVKKLAKWLQIPQKVLILKSNETRQSESV